MCVCAAGVCPDGMSFLSKAQCEAQGGACPRVCLDATADVECATECYDGCYCSPVSICSITPVCLSTAARVTIRGRCTCRETACPTTAVTTGNTLNSYFYSARTLSN